MSWICQRCKSENEKVVCDTCGFDSTMNYEGYRSLCSLPTRVLNGFYTWDDPQQESRRLSRLFAKAEQGDAEARYKIACKYYSGTDDSMPQDYVRAAQWLRMAADQGHTGAQGMLAGCYETGKGVSQDRTEALKWYEKAAAAGDIAAKNRYESLREQLETEQKQQERERLKRQAEEERLKKQRAEEERQRRLAEEERRKKQAEEEKLKKQREEDERRRKQQEAGKQQRQQKNEADRKGYQFISHTVLDKPTVRKQKKTFYDGSSAEKAWKIKSSLREAETERTVQVGLGTITIPPGLAQNEMLLYRDGAGNQLFVETELEMSHKLTIISGILLAALYVYYIASKESNPVSPGTIAVWFLVFFPFACLPGLGIWQIAWSARYKAYRKKMGLRQLVREPELLGKKVKRAGRLTAVTAILSIAFGLQGMIGEAYRIVALVHNRSCKPIEAFLMTVPLSEEIRKEVIKSHLIFVVLLLLIIILFVLIMSVKACSALLLGLCCAFASFAGMVTPSHYRGFNTFLFWEISENLDPVVDIAGLVILVMSLLIMIWGRTYFWGRLYLGEAKK